jgi:hypothetical protein
VTTTVVEYGPGKASPLPISHQNGALTVLPPLSGGPGPKGGRGGGFGFGGFGGPGRGLGFGVGGFGVGGLKGGFGPNSGVVDVVYDTIPLGAAYDYEYDDGYGYSLY